MCQRIISCFLNIFQEKLLFFSMVPWITGQQVKPHAGPVSKVYRYAEEEQLKLDTIRKEERLGEESDA